MLSFIQLQARIRGFPLYNLFARTSDPAASSAIYLSNGAIAGITVAGSVLLFLLVIGPLLIKLAKCQDRQHATACPVSSLSFAEHGVQHDLEQDGGDSRPRKLRKKNAVSEDIMNVDVKDVGTEEGSIDVGGRHRSLPLLPPVFSRPGSLNFGSPFGGGGCGNGSGSGSGNSGDSMTRSRTQTYAHAARMYGTREKQRGYFIHQNRRKTSWIDEDALHGPRISPRKNAKNKASWWTGRGLTRTLSRHLTLRRYRDPELARSPTLPYTESGHRRHLANGTPTKSSDGGKTENLENRQRPQDYSNEIEMKLRLPVRTPQQQGGSLTDSSRRVHAQSINPDSQRAAVLAVAVSSPKYRNNTALDAAKQLAGRARVPSLSAGTNRQRYSRLQQSSTDAELQAILRRTAERLEDGSQSARRQTLMLMTVPSTSKMPDPEVVNKVWIGQKKDYRCSCGKEHEKIGEMTPSPAKSQKSAPAALLCSELEGCSPKIPQGPSQDGTPRYTHKRTHTRQISYVSQASMYSEPDSLAASPSRRGSQHDAIHTALSSPSRLAQVSPASAHLQQALDAHSYSPASEQSSVLSTVYSEEEHSPPISMLKLDDTQGRREMERRAIAEALQACDTLDGGSSQSHNEVGKGEEEKRAGFMAQLLAGHSPRPLHIRKGTLGQIFPDGSQANAESPSLRQDRTREPETMISPQATSTFTLQAPSTVTDDPFVAHTPPARRTPQCLSQLFSPLPAELPGDTVNPSVHITGPASETPTPSPTHKRIVPPPHRLRPTTSSPTLGHYQEPETQIQPPSREPSPVVSESGLSSVYDSYRYSRYSDSMEGSQTLTRLSTATMLTVPTAEVSPTKTRWDEDSNPHLLVMDHMGGGERDASTREFRGGNLDMNRAVTRAGAYTLVVGPSGSERTGYTVPNSEDALPRSQAQLQPHREISLTSAVSNSSAGSTYSQEVDERDTLAPLRISRPTTMRNTMRVTSAVVELRRMNSQVSCVSGYSTAAGNATSEVEIASPTLPALRGGGFSPGKKGAGGGAKNYLALGSSPKGKDGEIEDGGTGSDGGDNSSEGNYNNQNANESKTIEIREDDTGKNGGGHDKKKEIALYKGGVMRSRRNTVVERFEQDLDRARQVLRESRGYNMQAIPEAQRKSLGAGDEGRASRQNQGLYDEKGFLKSPLARKGLESPLVKHI
ncbi:hypothetical protein F5Y19DRAFT_462316 [Xylariaceae sp. FL1651]|nr:hypothetical protein F5Y19DRAFT_462316 [Xylariaceae sp. FL1651]